jgi:hypothetical protein
MMHTQGQLKAHWNKIDLIRLFTDEQLIRIRNNSTWVEWVLASSEPIPVETVLDGLQKLKVAGLLSENEVALIIGS